jgi:hypothetical protein
MGGERHNLPLGYAPVPREMIVYSKPDGNRMSSLEILVWCALAMHRDLRTGEAFPSNRRLARILRADERSVKRAISVLVEAGFLIRRQQTRDTETGRFTLTIYTLAVGGEPLCLPRVPQNSPGDNMTTPPEGRSRPTPGGNLAGGKEDGNGELPSRWKRRVPPSEGSSLSPDEIKRIQVECIAELHRRLRDRGLFVMRPLTRAYKSQLAGEIRQYLNTHPPEQIRMAIDRIVLLWPEIALTLQQAINDTESANPHRELGTRSGKRGVKEGYEWWFG